MELSGLACRLTIIIGQDDRYHHRPLYEEIVHRAHDAGLAGATVFRGIEGFGKASTIHTDRILSLGDNLPVAIVIIDTDENVDAFLAVLDEIVTDGLVLRDDAEVTRYVGSPDRAPVGR